MEPATAKAADTVMDALLPLNPEIKAMFGGYCVYVHGKVVGLVCDGFFFLKRSQLDTKLDGLAELSAAYPGAKPTWKISPHKLRDSPDQFCDLVRDICAALPAPKKRKRE